MATTKTVLFDALYELVEDDFKVFKWRLSNGDKPIPQGKLENTKRQDVVDLMVQHYGTSDAGKIAVSVLHSIRQNDLAERLKGKLLGEDVPAGGGASSSGTSVTHQTPGVTQNIKTSDGGTVKSHVLQGGVYNGPVTFN